MPTPAPIARVEPLAAESRQECRGMGAVRKALDAIPLVLEEDTVTARAERELQPDAELPLEGVVVAGA